MTKDVFVY